MKGNINRESIIKQLNEAKVKAEAGIAKVAEHNKTSFSAVAAKVEGDYQKGAGYVGRKAYEIEGGLIVTAPTSSHVATIDGLVKRYSLVSDDLIELTEQELNALSNALNVPEVTFDDDAKRKLIVTVEQSW